MEDQRKNSEQQWPCPILLTSHLAQEILVARTTLHSNRKPRREWHGAQEPLLSFGKKKNVFCSCFVRSSLNTKENTCLQTSGARSPRLSSTYTGNEHGIWSPNLPLSSFPVTGYCATLSCPVSLAFRARPEDLGASKERCNCSEAYVNMSLC